MKLKAIILTACAAPFAVSCATRADSVAPASISDSTYASLSCEEATKRLDLAREREAALTRQQNDDALTMAFTLLPLRSLTGGDVSRELAEAKGEVLALERVVPQRCAADPSVGGPG